MLMIERLAGPQCSKKKRAAIPGQVYPFVRRLPADKTVAEVILPKKRGVQK